MTGATLTPAEQRVVNLAALGHTNAGIAARLHVTPKAVEWHLTNVYARLNLTRADLAGLVGVHRCCPCVGATA